MRINEIITKGKMLWSSNTFSQLLHWGNIWWSVLRVCQWILGLWGLRMTIYYSTHLLSSGHGFGICPVDAFFNCFHYFLIVTWQDFRNSFCFTSERFAKLNSKLSEIIWRFSSICVHINLGNKKNHIKNTTNSRKTYWSTRINLLYKPLF